MAFKTIVTSKVFKDSQPANFTARATDESELLPLSIPFELYRNIVQNIENRATLLSLCLTSYAFKAEAERILYESMIFPRPDEDAPAHLAFLQAITTVERLAPLVRTYHFPSIIMDKRDPENLLPRLLRCALQAMVNLRELRLGVAPQEIGSAVVLPFILEDCQFQLETLYVVQCRDVKAFLSFLSGQRRLRKLAAYLDNSAEILRVPANACPTLDVLQGNRRAIDALLPNRRITTLIYDPDNYDMNPFMPHLSESLAFVKTLSFDGCYLRPSLHVIVDYLKSLEYLELVTLHVGELDVICKILSLRGLILTEAFSFNTWERRVAIISQVFSKCPRLEFTDIQPVHHKDCQRLYQHWILPPGSDAPIFQELLKKDVVRRRFTG